MRVNVYPLSYILLAMFLGCSTNNGSDRTGRLITPSRVNNVDDFFKTVYDKNDKQNKDFTASEFSKRQNDYPVYEPDTKVEKSLPVKKYRRRVASSNSYSQRRRPVSIDNYPKDLLSNLTKEIGTYEVINSNDTLMLISFKLYGDYLKWRTIAKLNIGKLGQNYSVQKGMKLSYYIPDKEFIWNPKGDPFLIQRGHSLSKISNIVYEDWSRWGEIYNNNRPMIKNPNKIYAGFTLYYLPKSGFANKFSSPIKKSITTMKKTDRDNSIVYKEKKKVAKKERKKKQKVLKKKSSIQHDALIRLPASLIEVDDNQTLEERFLNDSDNLSKKTSNRSTSDLDLPTVPSSSGNSDGGFNQGGFNQGGFTGNPQAGGSSDKNSMINEISNAAKQQGGGERGGEDTSKFDSYIRDNFMGQ